MRSWSGPGSVIGTWLILTLAGCGSSDAPTSSGMAGMYRVKSQSTHRPCDGPGEAQALRPPYFVVVDELLFNGLVVNVYPCTAAERSSCDEQAFPLVDLGHPSGKEFIEEELSRSPGDSSCLATYTGNHLVPTAAGVQIRSEVRTAGLTLAQCSGDAEPSSGRSYPCSVVEVRDAERL